MSRGKKSQAELAAARDMFDRKYNVEPEQFAAVLKAKVKTLNAIITLNTRLAQAPKGAYLVFKTPSGDQQLSRKHMRSAVSAFGKSILEMKHFLRASKKKHREIKSQPSDLRGTYGPIYVGVSLQYFFRAGMKNDIFGTVGGRQLMGLLPQAMSGYVLRNTITMLFYIYAYVNGLQDPVQGDFTRSDAVMDSSFNNPLIPADFVTVENKSQPVWRMKRVKDAAGNVSRQKVNYVTVKKYGGGTFQRLKYATEKATLADSGLPANTTPYGAILSQYPEFNPAKFQTNFFQVIASTAYYSMNALQALGKNAELAHIQQADTRAAMLYEHNLVKQASMEWANTLQPAKERKANAKKGPKKTRARRARSPRRT